MKKYIFVLMSVLISLLISCSNDDITIAYQTTIKINPSTVTSSFYGHTSGDLDLLTGDYKLRTRLLVYDKDGELMYQEVKFLSNFTETMTSTPQLPVGQYMAIATTDVVKYNNSEVTLQFWALSDSTKLSKVKISNAGLLGHAKTILGVKSNSFAVSGGGGSISLNVEPAGALFYIYYAGIHTFSDVSDIGVGVQKDFGELSFDTDGNPSASFKSQGTNYAYWLDHFQPKDNASSKNVYSYSFQLPSSNYGLKFDLVATDGKTHKENFYGNWALNIEAGQQYDMFINLSDIDNGFSPTCVLHSSTNAKAVTNKSLFMQNTNSTLYLKNCK